MIGQNFFCKSSNQDTQQGYFLPEDDAFDGFKASALGKGKVFGVETVLERISISWLTAALSFCRPFGGNYSVLTLGHF